MKHYKTALLLIAMLSVIGISDLRADASFLHYPMKPGTRAYWFNPDTCPEETLPNVQAAFAKWGKYLDFPVIYKGETTIRKSGDWRDVVMCENLLPDFIGMVNLWVIGGRGMDADMRFHSPWQSGWPTQKRVALHEAGHYLGLNHSDDPASVMYEVPTADELTMEDIVAITSLYQSCIPRFRGDKTIFFPNLDGQWAILAPVDPARLGMGFTVHSQGPAHSVLTCADKYGETLMQVRDRFKMDDGSFIEAELNYRDGVFYPTLITAL